MQQRADWGGVGGRGVQSEQGLVTAPPPKGDRRGPQVRLPLGQAAAQVCVAWAPGQGSDLGSVSPRPGPLPGQVSLAQSMPGASQR